MSAYDIVEAFCGCNSLLSIGIMSHGWPDGQSYLKQEGVLTEAFDVVKNELMEMRGKNQRG